MSHVEQDSRLEATPETVVRGRVVSCQRAETRKWVVWGNLVPPSPASLHVSGEVRVPNSGIQPVLCPCGHPPASTGQLLLDLLLIQKPGVWPREPVWKAARYDVTYPAGVSGHSHVTTVCAGKAVADLDVRPIC